MFYNCFRVMSRILPAAGGPGTVRTRFLAAYLYVYDAAFAVPITDCGTIVKANP